MAPSPLVSLITINYNTLTDTQQLLESVEKLTYKNIEMIVVDNASKVSPGAALTAKFPWIKFIQSDVNLGFAGGNNLGIKASKGDYVFLVNSDTIVFPDFLEPIVAFMESHPDAGMATPKVLYPDGKTLQYAGAIRINPYTGRGRRLGLLEQDHGQYDKNYKTDLGHGAALIIPRRIIDLVGLMPELYFLYYEEHDWCEMVKRAGFSMYYIGDSKILHTESVSTGNDSPLKTYYLTRNRLIFMRRNFSGIPLLSGMLFFFTVSLPWNILKYTAKGKMTLLKAFLRGVGWNLTHLRLALGVCL
ncbi:glycosyltransferase family 2 protein [Chryseolinea lacunae]|uniref:Glycosyltransferase family 2 protein n=1 Tax=Chryseolinea lacunae TaxID=2801331 RepID=A0ABS1KXQ5_9BACT|nr:glycosyltransferase family 2 protein [Chryseolinea lacunae]MBL0744250.1 glycosyltransferase family 2 protein [Chryseolinea lacunae]